MTHTPETSLPAADRVTEALRHLAKVGFGYDITQADRVALNEAADFIASTQEEIARLREALGEKFCPRPCNDRPDNFDVGQCVHAGECGCGAARALANEAQP